ncbi:MAG TPA: peptidylprolyl isomerase [Streptosporangiaceae bacterium]|nr:peptidylprolyl isomerase [Streptosporangiaceae bacterium]
MARQLRIRHERSEVLELFLALYRELTARFSWEISVLPRPVLPEIERFREGLRLWRQGGIDQLPAWLTAPAPRDLLAVPGSEEARRGTAAIVAAIEAAAGELSAALDGFADIRAQARRVLDDQLDLDVLGKGLLDALGIEDAELELPLHCVLLAPLPSAGFLADGTRLRAGYVDCRRHRGATLAECVLGLVAWALLREHRRGAGLPAELAERLPGTGPYHRRLRAVLLKLLVEMTCGELVRSAQGDYRPGVDVLGSAWRFPRAYGAVSRHWAPYLAGATGRDEALDGLAAELGAYSPRWFVDCVDAASLAADFYLMEYLAADGAEDCAREFARWLPQLARDFAGQIDLVIGTELGHFERALDVPLPGPMSVFIRRVTAGDSQSAWPVVKEEMGARRALDLAVEAFSGPGIEFGGAAWAPIARTLRSYTAENLPVRIFIDRCFTLQHNNGCVFDKCFDVEDMRAVLDAQAEGKVAVLAAYASEHVRRAWHAHQARKGAGYDPSWLGLPAAADPADPPATRSRDLRGGGWLGLALDAAPPGGLGCGSALPAGMFAAGDPRDLTMGVQPRRATFRRPVPSGLDRYERASVTLATTLGPVRLTLFPDSAPYTVDNFVKLATGERQWIDPVSRACRNEPFYDGTSFFRRLPGYLIQGGDRTGTGQGGPGYRLPDEPDPGLGFDEPYLLGMANLGRDSTGSQFFITLVSAPHLTGQYTVFGAVADDASAGVARAIAVSAHLVILETVTVELTPDR